VSRGEQLEQSVISVQQFTNQYTLGLGFSGQPGKVKQPAAATCVEHDTVHWESFGEKS